MFRRNFLQNLMAFIPVGFLKPKQSNQLKYYNFGDQKYYFNETEIFLIENSSGTKFYYKNGKLHCEDGPAIEELNGTKKWFRNGLEHRDDGPAIIYPDGTKYWIHHGVVVKWCGANLKKTTKKDF